MTHDTHPFTTFGRRVSLPRLASRIAAAIAARYDRYLQRRALEELDDHMLRDIGCTPQEARRECAKPIWR